MREITQFCCKCTSLTFSACTQGVVHRVLVSPLDRRHFFASFYCCLSKQSSLLSGFEAPLGPMPRFQHCWPDSGAMLFSSPIKVSVTKPDVPVMSAGQMYHVLSVCRSSHSTGLTDALCTVSPSQLCGFSPITGTSLQQHGCLFG